jgi:predicted CXXCH cytochrome family protein
MSETTGGSSTACLGCHDGVLGQEVHRIGTEDAPVFDHPYDVIYPRRANGRFVPERPLVNQYRYWSIPDVHNGELVLPTGPTSGRLVVPANEGTAATTGTRVVRTLDGRVQCDSCHDPHDNGSAPFLRASAQDLCLICHDR